MPRPTCRGTASRSVSVVVYSNVYVSTQGVVKPVVTTEPLSKVVDVDVQGEMLDLKETVNSMVAQLSSLANEVIRVSIEVGTEGKLGGQAVVPDVKGVWKVSSSILIC